MNNKKPWNEQQEQVDYLERGIDTDPNDDFADPYDDDDYYLGDGDDAH